MKPEYESFLNELIEAKRSKCINGADLDRLTLVYAECQSFTAKFVERFPHLKKIAGFYGGVEHWWCVDVDGSIVDPTVEQFSPGGDYLVYDEDKHEVRLGRCMNCGDDIYGLKSQGSKCVCSKECEEVLNDEWNR